MSSSFIIQKFSKEYSTINFDLPVFKSEAVTSLSNSKESLAATSIGDYALFGGGSNNSSARYNNVDAYDLNLTKTTPTSMDLGRKLLAATSIPKVLSVTTTF